MNSAPDRPLLVFTTVSSAEEAARLSNALLADHLVACASAFPVTSRYVWNGKFEESAEVKLILKTSADRYAALEAAIVAAHGYDVPEILAVNVDAGLPDYLGWMREALTAKPN